MTHIRYKNYKLLCGNSIALGYFCATNYVALQRLFIIRDRKKLQMQLNFEKRNLKSCNGSLRFIRKGSKWQIFLCNLMQFCAYVTI